MLIGLLTASSASLAGPIDIFEFSMYVNSTETGATSQRDTLIGLGPDTLSAGLNASFASNLDADNVGTFSWSLTNNTGSSLTNLSLFGFLDAEIDETLNSFFNESSFTSDLVLGGGSGDGMANSFEIDEPGFIFGDIVANMLLGNLDNTNNLPGGLNDDVSMALGFDIGTLLSRQSVVATFDISLMNNNGLGQFDPNSNFGFWYNGSVNLSNVNPTPVPAPGTLLLILLGGLVALRSTAKKWLMTLALLLGSIVALPSAIAQERGAVTVDENPPECFLF